MIFGIDVNVLTRPNRTGTERYVFELIQEMKKIPLRDGESVKLYSSEVLPELDPLPAGWSVEVLKWPLPFKGWTHGRLSLELLLRTPNVFFSPAHEIPLLHGRTKIVSTVHDVAFRRLEDIYPQQGKKRQEWAISQAIKKANKLIVISEATRDDLHELYGVSEDNMTIARLAVRPEYFQASPKQILTTLDKYGIKPYEYFLSVGRVEKKKNIITLVKAFDRFKKETGSHQKLVLGGSLGFGGDEIETAIALSLFKDDIHVLGYVSEEDLVPLLRGANAYVFPSYYEGFGIPALEAMAAGIPLIASDIPALREVAKNAALFASPNSPAEWARHMETITVNQHLRNQLIDEGGARLEDFSWKHTAQKTWDTLRDVACGTVN